MSSSSILRKAVFNEAPAVIDNTPAMGFPGAYAPSPEDLAEELQYEYPDTPPEDIEAAISEAMDQLREAPESSEFRAPSSEWEASSSELDLSTSDLGVDNADLGLASDTDVLASHEPSVGPYNPEPETRNPELILEDARREAQQVLADADARAAEIERAAYEKGYEEGVAAGRAGGEEQAAEMLKQVMAIVDQATELHDTMLREAETEMVALCLEIARKIVQSELRTNPDVVTGIVSAAVKKIDGSPRVTIRVNPSHVEDLRKHWAETFGPDYREKEWIIEGDENVDAGGCVLDTKYGSIDARIGTQFEQIQKTFGLLLGTDE